MLALILMVYKRNIILIHRLIYFPSFYLSIHLSISRFINIYYNFFIFILFPKGFSINMGPKCTFICSNINQNVSELGSQIWIVFILGEMCKTTGRHPDRVEVTLHYFYRYGKKAQNSVKWEKMHFYSLLFCVIGLLP